MRRSLAVLLLAGIAVLWQVPVERAAAQNASAKVIVPHKSWDCGMAGGIPSPESGTLVLDVEIKLGNIYNVGKTPFGNRQAAVGQEGTLTGPKLSGSVMPGALDYELKLSNGVVEIEEILVLRAADGKYIYMRAAGIGPDANDVRVVMDFEAPNASDHAWLNSGKFVARRTINAASKTMTLKVYDVSAVTISSAAANIIRIEKPAGVAEQPWDYRKASPTEKRGAELITEIVTLGPSQSVGASKRGNRNIIPITGGELTGRIPGKVLFGGADYQNLSSPPAIDARYLWQATNGDVILVRNTGSGGLVPTFEVRTDSPYAFLNSGTYLSSPPGMKPGGVGITMYESVNQ